MFLLLHLLFPQWLLGPDILCFSFNGRLAYTDQSVWFLFLVLSFTAERLRDEEKSNAGKRVEMACYQVSEEYPERGENGKKESVHVWAGISVSMWCVCAFSFLQFSCDVCCT